MKIGEKIRYFREKEYMTQQEMAEKLFMSDRTIGHYETGKRTPSLETLKEMAKLLKVELDDFFQEETKRLMQLQYTYREFKEILLIQSFYNTYNDVDPNQFTSFLESDRYYLKLNRDYKGSAMTFLVWLLDGFYLVPLKSEWCDGENEIFIDDEHVKKVSKEDVNYIQKASGRMYIKSQNERNFAESIYSSQFEKMDFTITKNIDKDPDLYGFIFYDTEGLYAFDYEKETFYVKHKKGVMKVGYPEGEYDRFGFLEIESFGMDMPVLLKNEEIDSLLTYVSEQEKEAALLLDEFKNAETLEVRKKTGERYRKKIAFVDKMKRILEVSEEQEFSFLPTEEEVQIEREEEDERKRIKRNQISVEHIDATLNNKVLFVHEGGTFFYELYSDMIEKIGYQLIKTIEDRYLFLENVKGIIDTTYEPDIILLNLNEIEGALELIKEIRKLSESVKIVVMDTFFTENTVKGYMKSGANHFIMKPTYYDGMKKIFDKVLEKEE